MSLRIQALVAAMLAAASVAPATPATSGLAFGSIAFVNVNVLPMDRDVMLEHQSVVVEGARIVAVGPADEVRIPAGALRIDGTGKVLMPGVAEMHGHYPQQVDTQLTRDMLFLYVANGVTMVRGMQGGPQHLPLRYAIERREILGPRLWVSAPAMAGTGDHAVTDPGQARELVRQAKALGFDHIKVHEGLSLPVYDAIADTAAEVGIPFAGHVSNFVGLEHALQKGQRTIDHLDGFLEALIEDQGAVQQLGLFDLGRMAGQVDVTQIDRVVAATRQSGAGVVPTMALWEALFGTHTGAEMLALRPEVRYLPRQMVQRWVQATDQRVRQFGQDPAAIANILALRRRVLLALHRAGVPILLGTDSPQIFSVPGFSIHHEMQVMVESGMSPYEVLRAGTRAVAEFNHESWDYGSVAVGRRADLVLLNRDPRGDISGFADRAGVLVNGQWLSAEQIDQRLAEIAERYAYGQ